MKGAGLHSDEGCTDIRVHTSTLKGANLSCLHFNGCKIVLGVQDCAVNGLALWHIIGVQTWYMYVDGLQIAYFSAKERDMRWYTAYSHWSYSERQEETYHFFRATLTKSQSIDLMLWILKRKINHIRTKISYSYPREAHLKNEKVASVKKEKMRWNRKR